MKVTSVNYLVEQFSQDKNNHSFNPGHLRMFDQEIFKTVTQKDLKVQSFFEQTILHEVFELTIATLGPKKRSFFELAKIMKLVNRKS